MAGELIGIVNAKKSSTGIEGLGFAIPIDNVYDIMVEILREGYLHGKVTFGIQVSTLTLDEAYAIGGRQAGVYVISSQTGNFVYGDCIEKINGKTIANLGDYYAAINEIEIGDEVVFVVVRRSGTSYRRGTITVTAEEYVPGMFD